jgi:quinoprotein glucose dehydrogenase
MAERMNIRFASQPVRPPPQRGSGNKQGKRHGTIANQTPSPLVIAAFAAAAWTLPALAQGAETELSVAPKPGEWRYLNNDPQSTRYSPLDQINRGNFKDLKIAWRWKPAIGPALPTLGGTAQGNGDPTLAIYKNESTPIMVHGVLYTAMGGQRAVAAIDAVSGRQLWLWPGMDEGNRARFAPRRNAGRGVGYWTDGQNERIFVVTTGSFSWRSMRGPARRLRRSGRTALSIS